jgi:hypothetical protein
MIFQIKALVLKIYKNRDNSSQLFQYFYLQEQKKKKEKEIIYCRMSQLKMLFYFSYFQSNFYNITIGGKTRFNA